jgi:hypothetical protein
LFRFDNLRFWFANRHEIENSKTVEKVAILDFIFGGDRTGILTQIKKSDSVLH